MRTYYPLLLLIFTFCGFISCDTDGPVESIPDNLVIEIEEIPEANTVLAAIDEPSGSGLTEFLLISESQEGAFKIDDNGQIKVNANGLFDYESSPTLLATFTASKGENVNTLNLTVNLTDVVEQYQLFKSATFSNYDMHFISLQKEDDMLTYYGIGSKYYRTGFRLRYDEMNRLTGFDIFISNDGYAARNHDFTYNDNDQIISVYYYFSGSDGGAPSPYTRTIAYEGNTMNFLNEDNSFDHSVTLDNQGKIINEFYADGTEYSYDYDGANLITFSDNGEIVTNEYTKLINPFGDPMFRPIYDGFIFSEYWTSNAANGNIASNFIHENFRNFDLSNYVFNKNGYPILNIESNSAGSGGESIDYNYE